MEGRKMNKEVAKEKERKIAIRNSRKMATEDLEDK